MSLLDFTFEAMGCEVRLVLGEPGPHLPPAPVAAERERQFILDFDAALSRFREDSELSALNADPRSAVPASELLRTAVGAGLWAAERTGGLVDPTLVRELESVGYAGSRAGVAAAPLSEALAVAPPRRSASPNPNGAWREISVDNETGLIRRPPGVQFDTGGSGKGLAADMVAERLRDYSFFVVDCGGDIRVGGTEASARPFEIEVEHPLTGRRAHVLRLAGGAVATSGLNVRLWRRADGSYRHHLLDPATGESAWTGLVGVTALGATALEAETLSKAALLSGPEGGRDVLSGRGGFVVHEGGRVELVGPLKVTPRLPEGMGRLEAVA
jgi:thiamine biosynthesis lipoprotein